MLRVLACFALFLGFSAEARIKNFRQYEVKSFTCGAAMGGKPSVLGLSWDEESDQIVVLTKVLDSDEPQNSEEIYDVHKSFPSSQTLMFVGRPADGSRGFVQVILRDEKPTTVSVGAKGVSYVDCEIEAVKIED